MKTANDMPEDWKIEVASPGALNRRGLTKDMLIADKEISVERFPIKGGSGRILDGQKLTMPNGITIDVSSFVTDGKAVFKIHSHQPRFEHVGDAELST